MSKCCREEDGSFHEKRLGISRDSLVKVSLLSSRLVAGHVASRDIVGNHNAIRMSEGEYGCFGLPLINFWVDIE
jgi:hypothetical protein